MYIIYEKRKDQEKWIKTNLKFKKLSKAAQKIKLLKRNFKLDFKLIEE